MQLMRVVSRLFSGCSLHFWRTYPVEVKYLEPNQHLDPRQVVGRIHQAHAHLGTRRANAAQK